MGIKGTAQWNGTLKAGNGNMKPDHGPDMPFALTPLSEGHPQTNPEELIGAALAGCFSMALSLALEQAGAQPKKIQTAADVKLRQQGDDFTITDIALNCTASAAGIDADKFQSVAEAAKKACPVSKALAGTKIVLTAKFS